MPVAGGLVALLYLAAAEPLSRQQQAMARPGGASRPLPPHGGGSCSTPDDCSLGGECTGGRCSCDPWFTGPSCALLNLQRPENTDQGTCGPNFDSYFSWGGRALHDPKGGLYHLYASFMCDHKDLGSWTTASASAHFVSSSPVGPFSFSSEQCDGEICTPAVVPWSHNTVAMVDPGGSAAGAEWQIWHIGDGVVPKTVWSPCYNKSSVGGAASRGAVDSAASITHTNPEHQQRLQAPTSFDTNTAWISTASGPAGPWTRALNNTGVPIDFTGSWTKGIAGNPAPLLLPDGSVNLYFTATTCPPNSGAWAPNCIAVAKSTNGWAGPYKMVNISGHSRPITFPESEDPSAFIDPRGNYHLLTNVNTFHRRCAQGTECGGHAWSKDGVNFSNLTIGAFGPYITFANGSGWPNAFVERPLVSQDASGKPLAFYVGMGRKGYLDSCNWAQLFCTTETLAAGKCQPTLNPNPSPAPPEPPAPPAPPSESATCALVAQADSNATNMVPITCTGGIKSVVFANYGANTGDCQHGLHASQTCNLNLTAAVSKVCVGEKNCTLSCAQGGPNHCRVNGKLIVPSTDPCGGFGKTIGLVVAGDGCGGSPTPPPAPGPPFCGHTPNPGMDGTVRLSCGGSSTIAQILFASFGTPKYPEADEGRANCSVYTVDPTCHANTSMAVVRAACLGQRACAIPTSLMTFGVGDPCVGRAKDLAIVATCSGGTTGIIGGGASCTVNTTACPPPRWPPQWNLTLSTCVQPGSGVSPGYFEPNVSQPWGLVSLDWSVAGNIWQHGSNNRSMATIEATSTEGCRRIKLRSPHSRCFIYHNMELALQALESQRAVMYDPTKKDWFLQYTDGRGKKNGTIYDEGGAPGAQYFWDYRIPVVVDYVISSTLKVLDNPWVDGVFTDDLEGFPSEHDYGPINTNISYSEVAEIQFATLDAHGRLLNALLSAGKYNWQAMGAGYQGEYVGGGVPSSPPQCAAWMRKRCTAAYQQQAFTMSFDTNSKYQSIAAFLIVRGPTAFLGFGWQSGQKQWDAAFTSEVGTPTGLCTEVQTGVFERHWSYGTVSLDCNTWTAIVPTKDPHPLPPPPSPPAPKPPPTPPTPSRTRYQLRHPWCPGVGESDCTTGCLTFDISPFPIGCDRPVEGAALTLPSCPVKIGPCAGDLIVWIHNTTSGELLSGHTTMGPMGLVVKPAAGGHGSEVRVALGLGGGSFAGQSFSLDGGEISTHEGGLCLKNGTATARNNVSIGSCQSPQAKTWVAFKI